MAYAKMISNYVDKAFTMLQDIPVEVTLVRSGGKKFDFSTGGVVDGYTDAFTFKAIVLNTKRRDTDTLNIRRRRIILKRKDIPYVGKYDKAIIGNQEWDIDELVEDRVGYIVYLELYKEVNSLTTLPEGLTPGKLPDGNLGCDCDRELKKITKYNIEDIWEDD